MNKAEIQQAITEEIKVLGSKMVEAPWHNEEFYKMWLAQTHYMVRHTTKMLALSAAHLPVEDREKHYVVLHHIEGEVNHDLMPLKDLKDFGSDISQYPELAETSMIYQLQYYWIVFKNPLAFCGYAFLLEGAAKFYGANLLKNLQDKYGKKGSLFLKVHTISDQEHYDDATKFMDSLSVEDCRAILGNMKQANLLYCQMVDKIKEHCLRQNSKAA